MNIKDNEKIIEQVKKLLALSSSPNENEAKLAMKRAQELIAKYSINLVEDSEEKVIEIRIPYQKLTVGISDWTPNIIYWIAPIFGVAVLKSLERPEIIFIGYQTNIKVAVHACSVILNQLNADLRIALKKESFNVTPYSFLYAYWEHASHEIYLRFKEEKAVGEGLVVYDKTKEYLKKFRLSQSQLPSSMYNERGAQLGAEAGKNAQLRSGVEQKSNERKLIG